MKQIADFISRWKGVDGSERANYQLFLTELCTILNLPLPDPANKDTEENSYVFERRVTIEQPDGTENNGYIDLYKRDSFVLEAKQSGKALDTSGWDKAMLKAHNQADQYARALPISEGRPPFIIVVDVGRNIELYSEFSRSGATYTAFPDANSHRLRLEDLHRPEVQERLKAIWLNPLSLDPSRQAAKVTKKIAIQLAHLAKSLESVGHHPQGVSAFLMRCLFTMFSEDVGLLPNRSFTTLLEELQDTPEIFADMLESLWQTMNTGGFSSIIKKKLLKFNGGLFADNQAISLDKSQIRLLLEAAKSDWKLVEPAIFGTLLERALNVKERHKLGAHYTPRAYVERLVLPTIIEPLRREWQEVQVAVLAYEQQGKHKQAVTEVKKFHMHLCNIKVLDPACGTGNFLYVTLEHMKRLEGEVLNLLHDLGEQASMLEMDGVTVDPHQFLGLEINPRAARIAEMVLWIGYLQWHYRTHGNVNPPEPVLRDFKNIENRDALINYERKEVLLDVSGNPITRWDGESYIPSQITGEMIPDDSFQIEQYRYIGVTKAEWPKADYIIGNPPFIGDKAMRRALSDGYVDALRSTWKELPESADFVMYWWHIAAETIRMGKAHQFGFITTNSIKQAFNRRIIEPHLNAKNPLSITFAIPDHPWVDSEDGAAVRIAMTVGTLGEVEGRLLVSIDEKASDSEEIDVIFQTFNGKIFENLATGANVAGAKALKANSNISSNGVMVVGSGFILSQEEAISIGLRTVPDLDKYIKHYRNYNDLTDRSRNAMIIDFFGLTINEVQQKYPNAYQWILEKVKPQRDQNNRQKLKRDWWIFGEPRQGWRRMSNSLDRYICTGETGKHRHFQFLDRNILPDHRLIGFGLDDPFYLGVLSSRIHVIWALKAGGTLENRPVYNKTLCFDKFPFPSTTIDKKNKIRILVEQLDSHRKRQQSLHSDLTLTSMYNTLEKMRIGSVLNEKDKDINKKGLISILKELHDDIDRAVLDTYGWLDLAEHLIGKPGGTTPYNNKSDEQAMAEDQLLNRLVKLNKKRAEDEAQGVIHWLRPEYQNPDAKSTEIQTQGELEELDKNSTEVPKKSATKQTWPKEMREQVVLVRTSLKDQSKTVQQIASQFKYNQRSSVQAVLDALESLGMVNNKSGVYSLS
ncbi:class I SAM-dependent DNA methyltransferase [Acinetobacter sp. MB5]|uniref:class I SAM-dependent DNA methyltransferase n=1 Tax=Acinetobacter sp. MB5 TaxID=2069438 RepID=UPI000DCFBE46|nr:DNA methyltransferase [Acinetobacter sp. MB5]